MRLTQLFTLGACALLCGALGAQVLTVDIQGPGGHSNGNYGNVNAVHAAARAVLEIERAVPSAVISGMTGGVTVNAIAGDAHFTVTLVGDAASQVRDAEAVKAAVRRGCESENAFRGVKPGDVKNSVPADIRWTVQ